MGRSGLLFYAFSHAVGVTEGVLRGEKHMNFQANMIPGICALAVGALLTFFGGRLCHREKDVPQVKLLGVALAVVGAIMIFMV